jgi:hypothetical protein
LVLRGVGQAAIAQINEVGVETDAHVMLAQKNGRLIQSPVGFIKIARPT